MVEPVTIEEVPMTRAGVRRFLRVPYAIYEGDPHWVAPLESDLHKVFSRANPFLHHADVQLWVARSGGRDVGRVAGIVDTLYHQHQQPDTAFFGFFESVDRQDVSQALLDQVRRWAAGRGLSRVLGPMNPSTNDECGLLIEGFDRPPVFMMPYNPTYYPRLVEQAGFGKAKDLIAFHIDVGRSPLDRLARIRERFEKRHPELKVRPLRRSTFWSDLELIRRLYNEAWEPNWGFVPMTEEEIQFLAARLKPLLVEGLVWLVETASGAVGFLLALPDYNEALQGLRGKILSPGLFRFLPYAFGWKYPRMARVMVLGVSPSFRVRGLESVMLAAALQVGYRLGFKESEASWVLEDNVRSRGVIEAFGGKPYKTYRIYESGASV